MQLKTIFQLSGVFWVSCALAACGAETIESQPGGNASGGDATGGTGTDDPGAGGTDDPGTGGTSTGGTADPGLDDPGWTGDGNPLSTDCFAPIQKPGSLVAWQYDSAGVVVGTHCHGTDHQDIDSAERIVFLGDSIMNGTLPTPADKFVRSLLTTQLQQRFSTNDVADCSVNGERNDHLAEQRGKCFSAENMGKKTLTLIIMGGNDIADIAGDKPSIPDSLVRVDQDVLELRDTIEWLKDPQNFPNGNNVVFANVYEYTDTSADLSSCVLANLVGLSGKWLSGARVLTVMNEGYAQVAADTGADMVFMMEAFCGHGYKAADASLQCYRGPGAENWFDLTCIHPTPTGHSMIAELFMDVIEE